MMLLLAKKQKNEDGCLLISGLLLGPFDFCPQGVNLILNRNFEIPKDGGYQLAPLGEFPCAAIGITPVIDETACRLMVAAFENANFSSQLIDFDHFSLDATKHSEAAGWITDLKFTHPVPQASRLGQSRDRHHRWHPVKCH